jgi:hypothetical protein
MGFHAELARLPIWLFDMVEPTMSGDDRADRNKQGCPHAAVPSANSSAQGATQSGSLHPIDAISRPRARASRDITVPIGTSVASAISR